MASNVAGGAYCYPADSANGASKLPKITTDDTKGGTNRASDKAGGLKTGGDPSTLTLSHVNGINDIYFGGPVKANDGPMVYHCETPTIKDG